MTDINSEYLYELARAKSGARRQELAAVISDMFAGEERVLSERERALMFDILHKIVRDSEMAVRRIVGEQLAALDDAPRELIKLLANDEIEVAFPILEKSLVLRDEDLIEVVRHRTREHQLAVAVRETVSEEVSDALVKAGDESVITTLLKNAGSEISLATMEFLVEESKRVDAFQEPILRREDLDPELAKRMYLWVSAALRQYIVDNFPVDRAALDELLERSARAPVEADEGESKAGALAEEVDKEGLGLVKMMIRALKDGEVFLFEAMFRRLTGLRNTLIKRILFESGGEGLAIACKASSVAPEDFSTIYTLSRMSESGGPADHEETQRILDFYDKVPVDAAKDVVARWRRDVDYLKAIRELEIGN